MITWNDNLRSTESVKSNIAGIKRRLRWRKTTSVLNYCIALASNEENLFDIYNMGELLFRYYRDSDVDIHIVGLARTKDEAFELVRDIVQDVYTATGGFDVRKYFNRV